MALQEIKKYAEEKLEELKKLTKERTSIDIDDISLDWSLPLGRTLGLASYRAKKIKLNKELAIEFGKEYIDEVLPHEAAHFIVYKIYPFGMRKGVNGVEKIRPHGKEFKAACEALGFKGRATTSLFSQSAALKSVKPKSRQQRRFKIKCNCGDYVVSTRRKNSLIKKSAVCARCGSKFIVVGEIK